MNNLYNIYENTDNNKIFLGNKKTSRTEFKVKLVDDLEETVIGFLNSRDVI